MKKIILQQTVNDTMIDKISICLNESEEAKNTQNVTITFSAIITRKGEKPFSRVYQKMKTFESYFEFWIKHFIKDGYYIVKRENIDCLSYC